MTVLQGNHCSPNFTNEKLRTERLSNVVKITQLVNGSVGFGPSQPGCRVCTLTVSCSALKQLRTKLIWLKTFF